MTRISPMKALMSQVLALLCISGFAQPNTNMSPETMMAMVTMVPINIVAERMMSWTKMPTEVSVSPFLMPMVL